MKRGIGTALVLAGCLFVPGAHGQQGNSGAASNQDGQAAQPAQQAKPAQAPKPAQDANPFPTDTTNVPVMPSRENPEPNVPQNSPASFADQIEDSHYAVPPDTDPVASPDQVSAGGDFGGQVSSSNSGSLDSILPPAGSDEPGKKGKKGSDELEGPPKETAAQDISVGKYYLDNKNWRAAMSRFESALVLSPEDPEVYWGLAESQRHIGDYAKARANYEKVIEYDPDSKHAKEAIKALKEPEFANAKPAPVPAQPHQ
jgi:tetratricopeptide (TPR) repeat protein